MVRTCSVLIVDDNTMVRKAICDLFKRDADFVVCGEAANGREAVEKARLLHPALIVTDFSMPVMNGLEATRALKKLLPMVPVILYSIHVDARLAQLMLAAGASAAICKKDAARVLIKTARTLLSRLAA
jgi:DNA-binding NarL/FixJ family response regulator